MKNGKLKNGEKNGKPSPGRVIHSPAGTPDLAALFSRNLRRHREKMELTQAELGARAAYTTGHVSMLERGTREPSFEAITRLALALNVKDPRQMFAK